jgi:hypothetical protein
MQTKSVRAMILTGNGINCERETAFACGLAGADEVEPVSIWDWAAGKVGSSSSTSSSSSWAKAS